MCIAVKEERINKLVVEYIPKRWDCRKGGKDA